MQPVNIARHGDVIFIMVKCKLVKVILENKMPTSVISIT